MSGKAPQNKNTKEQVDTFTNPYFPNQIFQKIDGQNVVVGVKLTSNTNTKRKRKTKK